MARMTQANSGDLIWKNHKLSYSPLAITSAISNLNSNQTRLKLNYKSIEMPLNYPQSSSLDKTFLLQAIAAFKQIQIELKGINSSERDFPLKRAIT